MKTVAQWAEQLPELIRIELLTQAKTQIKLDKNAIRLHYAIYFIDWVGLGYDFWEGVYYNSHDLENSADYIDESVPYTKSEVEVMILEYADPNDEVCKVMLANVGKSRVVAPSANAKPIVLDELGQEPYCGEFKVEAPKEKKSSIYSKVIKTLKAENEALKREVEALDKKEFSVRFELIELKLNYQKRGSAIEAQKETIADLVKRIRTLGDTIYSQRETIKTLTQMRVAPKKEQSIFFDLLEHLNIIKK